MGYVCLFINYISANIFIDKSI